MKIEIEAIGFVEAVRSRPDDDYWGGAESCITLTEKFTPQALQGLAEYSHVEVIFLFHGVDPSNVVTGARHPRGTPGHRAAPACSFPAIDESFP